MSLKSFWSCIALLICLLSFLCNGTVCLPFWIKSQLFFCCQFSHIPSYLKLSLSLWSTLSRTSLSCPCCLFWIALSLFFFSFTTNSFEKSSLFTFKYFLSNSHCTCRFSVSSSTQVRTKSKIEFPYQHLFFIKQRIVLVEYYFHQEIWNC